VVTKDRTYETRITGVWAFQGVRRLPLAEARSGEIVALSGLDDVAISDVVRDPAATAMPARITVDEPTVTMVFQVSDGPLAGRSGGTYLTSRHLRQRIYKESYANPSIHVIDGETPDQFRVLGRGELQLAVLIEAMRREGFELCVRSPEVVVRDGPAGREEPIERLVIDVAVAHLGAVSQVLGPRKARLLDQRMEGSRARLEYLIPTRGLFGLRAQLLTASRGTAIPHSVFEGWMPHGGPIPRRTVGAMVADRSGPTTPYAIFHLQERGTIFVGAGVEVYEGMVVGEASRANDLNVNICREKKLTNIRAAGRDENVILTPPRIMTLERALEWIRDDEMVEVTPNAIRLRKRVLQANRRSVRFEDHEVLEPGV
jgi:GTP-binding protein